MKLKEKIKIFEQSSENDLKAKESEITSKFNQEILFLTQQLDEKNKELKSNNTSQIEFKYKSMLLEKDQEISNNKMEVSRVINKY